VKNLSKVRFNRNRRIALLAGVLIHTAPACGDAIVGRRYASDSSSGGSTDSVTIGTSAVSPQPSHGYPSGGSGYPSGSSSFANSLPTAGTGGLSEPTPTLVTSATGGYSSTSAVSYTIPEVGTGGIGGTDSTPPNTTFGTAGTMATSQHCVIGVAVNVNSIVCNPAPAIGDVDCNGVVNAVDALRVGQRAENLETPPFFEPAGDINCDGCLTTDDATLISNIDVGNLVPTSCP
jgi:hypothetical protein